MAGRCASTGCASWRRERPARHRGRGGRLRACGGAPPGASGAEVTVLEAREAGGSFAASAGSSRVLRFEYGAAAHYTELVLARASAWRELEGCSARRSTTRPGMLWFAVEQSRYLEDSLQTSWLPASRRACSSRPRPRAASRRSRSRASRRCCTTRRAACCTRAARRSAWRAWHATRACRARGSRRARRRQRVRRAGRRQPRASRPGARHHGRLDERAAAGAPIRSTQQVNVYLRVPRPGLPVWIYDLDVYGLGDDGGAGLKVVGMRSVPTSIPTIPRRARGARPRRCAARGRGAPASARPGLARRRDARARRRRVLLCADADRDGDRRSPRRAHRRRAPASRATASSSRPPVARRCRRPRARAGAFRQPGAVPPARAA